jgi:methyltransferase (TIGR00027 family)
MQQSNDFSIDVDHVSETAYLVAACRLVESRRADRHFDDSLAAKLLGNKGDEMMERFAAWKFGEWMMAVRTVLIDQYLLRQIANGATTIVNLAAGLDTRPYRMKLPQGLNWIEVDYEGITHYKADKLKDETPVCNLKRICVDLANKNERDELFRSFAELGPFAVLTEGLLIYLDPADVDALSDKLHAMNDLRGWIMDITTRKAFQAMRHVHNAGAQSTQKQVRFKFLPDNGMEYFVTKGWALEDFTSFMDGGLVLNREVPEELRAVADYDTFRKVGIGVLSFRT